MILHCLAQGQKDDKYIVLVVDQFGGRGELKPERRYV